MTEDPKTEDPSKRIGDYEVLGVLGARRHGEKSSRSATSFPTASRP